MTTKLSLYASANKLGFVECAYSIDIILLVFSACGGIGTGSKLSVLTAYFPVLA